jgi:hypothetical protein
MSASDECCETFYVGGVPFIYFPTIDGGRLIPVSSVMSIVPNFKEPGSMVFLANNEGRAIKVPQTPDQIADDLTGSEAPEAD